MTPSGGTGTYGMQIQGRLYRASGSSGYFFIRAGANVIGAPVFPVEHPECVLFGPQFDQFVAKAVGSNGLTPHQVEVGALTSAVAAALPKVPPAAARILSRSKCRPAVSTRLSSARFRRPA